MINAPERLELSLAVLKNTKSGKNILQISDLKTILGTDLLSLQIEIKTESLLNTLQKECQIYRNNVEDIPITNTRLIALKNGDFDDVNISALSNNKQKLWGSNNCLIVKIQPYNGTVPNGTPIFEKYLSGWKTPQNVFSVSNAAALPHNFKDFDSYSNFNAFVLKAFDSDGECTTQK